MVLLDIVCRMIYLVFTLCMILLLVMSVESSFPFHRIFTTVFLLTQQYHYTDDSVDLCRSRPLGTPLGDLTTGCQDYTVCEALSDNRVVEKYISCKKGYLFSQLRQRCVLAKKVGVMVVFLHVTFNTLINFLCYKLNQSSSLRGYLWTALSLTGGLH